MVTSSLVAFAWVSLSLVGTPKSISIWSLLLLTLLASNSPLERVAHLVVVMSSPPVFIGVVRFNSMSRLAFKVSLSKFSNPYFPVPDFATSIRYSASAQEYVMM